MCKCQTCTHAAEIIEEVLHCDKNLFEDCSPGKGDCRSCRTVPECDHYSPGVINPTYWGRVAN